MSATVTLPALSAPSERIRHSLSRPIVTVSSAQTHGPSAIPPEESPLGISHAITYAPHAFIHPISAAFSPSAGRESPVPKRQSTTTAYRRRGIRPSTSPRYFALTAAQSSENFSAMQSAATSSPASCRMRAATNPSPPLLPPPQTKSASPPSVRASASLTARASASPARSMSVRDGVPAAIAASSNRRICSLE